MQRSSSRRCAGLRWCAGAATALLLCAPRGAPAQEVRPLDPLTERERAAAITIATGNDRVRSLVAGRESDVAYAELFVVKAGGRGPDTPDRPAVSGRFAEVLIATFEREFQGIRVLVDLQRGVVTDVSATPAGRGVTRGTRGFSVPFSPRERALAREVALRSPELRAALGAASLEGFEAEGLPITEVSDVCPSGRCMEMIFSRGDTYLTSTVIVDIPSRTSRFRRGPR
jgi:hypothetical protein